MTTTNDPRTEATYRMWLRNGNVYYLAADGAVLDRTDGPRGWDYSGKWVILGFKRRHHSRRMISLEEAVAGEDVGQGWVMDLDHGTVRMWGGPRFRKLGRIERTDV